MQMNFVSPFDNESGVWLRCALHAHTTSSDGWLQPHIQRRYHAWGGVDVLAITDHDMLTPEPAGSDDLILLPGVEISLIAPESGGPLHLLGIGVGELPHVDRDATLRQAAEAVRTAGGLPYVAHPVWSGLHTNEVDGIELCAGIEIFNAGCEVEQGRGHNDAHADIWLSMGHRLHLIATDDTHYPGFDAFRAWTMVHATTRSREAVLDALRSGHFYATSGPRITALEIEGNDVIARTTPVRSIHALGNPHFGVGLRAGRHELTYHASRLPTSDGQTLEGQCDGELLTGGRFAWRDGQRYMRIVATDQYGNRAWSNPIWRD